jgi:hypothetical protein
MMHPDTELKMVSPEIGVGVFATRLLPKGTITYVVDPLEIIVEADDPLLANPVLGPLVRKYATIMPNGGYEMSWDNAKYMNHCCHYNTLTTGFGFEIAVRDIQAGEQLRDDYGLFNVEYDMELLCDYPDCRKRIRTADFDRLADQWDADARDALAHARNVPQKLWVVMDPELRAALSAYLETGQGFVSVRTLKHETENPPSDAP